MLNFTLFHWPRSGYRFRNILASLASLQVTVGIVFVSSPSDVSIAYVIIIYCSRNYNTKLLKKNTKGF